MFIGESLKTREVHKIPEDVLYIARQADVLGKKITLHSQPERRWKTIQEIERTQRTNIEVGESEARVSLTQIHDRLRERIYVGNGTSIYVPYFIGRAEYGITLAASQAYKRSQSQRVEPIDLGTEGVIFQSQPVLDVVLLPAPDLHDPETSEIFRICLTSGSTIIPGDMDNSADVQYYIPLAETESYTITRECECAFAAQPFHVI